MTTLYVDAPKITAIGKPDIELSYPMLNDIKNTEILRLRGILTKSLTGITQTAFSGVEESFLASFLLTSLERESLRQFYLTLAIPGQNFTLYPKKNEVFFKVVELSANDRKFTTQEAGELYLLTSEFTVVKL